MGVLHDYHCSSHGYFENTEPECLEPSCDGEVMKVFLQAPGVIGDATKHNDRTINQLAMDFQMTNVKSAKSGESQAGYYTRKNKTPQTEVHSENVPREPRPGDAAIWGKGMGALNMKNILAGQAVKSVRGESVGVNPKEVGNLTGPRAASYIGDHQNLKIEK